MCIIYCRRVSPDKDATIWSEDLSELSQGVCLRFLKSQNIYASFITMMAPC